MGSRASASQPGLACGQQPVQIVAHRGGGGDPAPWGAPESSLLAFRRALELGADAVECDVRVSADGVPFVIHDSTVDRTTDGSGSVAQLSTRQLRDLRLLDGQRIPLLEEVLAQVLQQRRQRPAATPAAAEPATGVALLCELKSRRCVAPVCALVTPLMLATVEFLSFDWAVLREMRRRLPEAKLSPILAKPMAWHLRRAGAIGASSVDVQYQRLTAPFAAAARRRGVSVRVWTVDDPPQLSRPLGLGVAGITTNRPAALLHWLGRRGAR